MARLLGIEFSGALYHVNCRGSEQTHCDGRAVMHWGFEGTRGGKLLGCGLQYGRCFAEASEGADKKDR